VSDPITALVRRLVSTVPGGSPDGATPPAGMAVGIAVGDRSWVAAYGERGDAVGLSVSAHHDLASVTKAVGTTTALIGLISAGAVTLDNAVGTYVPSFADDAVTVRHLLLHRGGLAEWHPLYMAADSYDDAIDAAARLPRPYATDSGRHYSDLGFLLLGRVVERAAGSPLREAVAALVTEPLGLSDTGFAPPRSDDVVTSARGDDIERAMIDTGVPYPVPYRSTDFERWRTQPIVGEANDGNAFHACGGVAGHAGLFSTIDDLLRWGRSLSTCAGPWKHEVLESFAAPGPDEGQSLGFRRYDTTLAGRRVTVLGHPGFVGCAAGFVPELDVAVAMASNRLVTGGTPVPTELLWREVLDVLTEVLS
jgi:CubicO group peptidase (beta-lactamase class C family)